ncbi:metallophosphoesterase family protein [Gracilibacillus alcaliphilus]|uniref:metallophosphoesterase family protein n=1 Tax=Gracilibacillus alcaliphilus TaxID=1401441 RepID=UPI00195D9CF7|nr:metallophosphoesterase family protein [Gracilibacillus alcaliphilus]MBM7676812.1 putative MPP superfamily phosphohydrolase [Gracilibacillus alcaliphilus]
MLKNKDSFKILQLTDLHIGATPLNADDQKTFDLIRTAAKETDPDLIVVTGDLIWSEGVEAPEESFHELLEVFNSLEKPIAVTYGNHDTEEGITRSDLRGLESKLTHAVEKKHSFIIEDRESYCVEIREVNGDLAHVLYIIDSGADDPLGIGTYEFVHPKQINWFNDVSALYRQEKKQAAEDLLFLHIPLPEYHDAWENGQAFGYKYEEISSPVVNTGLFTSLLLNQQVKGVFCGHDHDNDFEADYYGIRLCFGRITGFNCYGDISRGARVSGG